MFLILALEFQLLKIGEGHDRPFYTQPSRFRHILQPAEHRGNAFIPFAYLFLNKRLHAVLAIVPSVDSFLCPRIVRVMEPAILAFVVISTFIVGNCAIRSSR